MLEFERINEKQFTKLLNLPMNKSTCESHLECLQQPMLWTTLVKVAAIATFSKYLCTTLQMLMIVLLGNDQSHKRNSHIRRVV